MKKLILTLFIFTLISSSASATSFKDLSASHKNAAAIEALAELEILKGDGNTGNFAPERTLNRAEFAKIIILAKGETVNNIEFKPVFPDVKESDWFAPYIIKANELGIMQGTGEGKAEPGQPVKMVEALAMALRAYNVSVEENASTWYQPYLNRAQNDNLLSKVATSFDRGLPRSEAAQMIINSLSEYDNYKIPNNISAAIEAEAEVEASSEVIVNGKALTQSEIAMLDSVYGGSTQKGNFWYDTRSGLAGEVGQPVQFFMKAGHQFGSMSANASSGNTGVYINGRELPQLELQYYEYLIGYIEPGRYWLDSNGDAGVEGETFARVNLLAAAGGGSNSGSSGSGDNFWSAGVYSSGNNYDNNNSGYAWVPGVGGVGYGDLAGGW